MATLLMQTLLALCFWRLALRCKLSHIPGGKGIEGWLWQPSCGAELWGRKLLRVWEPTATNVWEGPMWTTTSPFLLSTTLRSMKCQVLTSVVLRWGCSNCSALNRPAPRDTASCVLHILYRCVKTSCQSQVLYWVCAAFLLKKSLQAHLNEFARGCTLLVRLIVGNDKLHTPAFIFMPI